MVNLLLGKPCTASSYVLPYEPARAVDGVSTSVDPTSRWLCNTLPGWMQVDLGKNYLVNRWVVRNMGNVMGWNTYPNGGYNMSDYKLQYMNTANGTWIDMDGVVSNTNAITDRTFPDQIVRYVRLYVTKGLNINPQLASCMEFEVYEHPSADLTSIQVAGGTLEPVFASNVTSYTVNLGYDTEEFALNPVAKDPNATVVMTVDGSVVHPNSCIEIEPGTSMAVTITVTAGNGSVQKVYTVNAVRASSPYLESLFTDPELSPSFSSKVYSYNLNAVGRSSIELIYIGSAADFTINGNIITTYPYSFDITTESSITIVTTSTYGVDSRTYKITLIK
ncbi:cadherin-like beta sandwich domain-containing protein [Anaeromicropila populeti]|uniref:Cadherin-like beta sandwich domain-containing protein n=1 Tax=Anaeromicropila populeti TaxID=37658 RepID=A0A1I6J8W1_9FIRM|nr:cadherin-like beta sandwich domain-containing protein [Anaeromicropila populeti]SFR75378.1 Cadherin-like beta sandwich domain-containing protein [Anaeromicropila populeti]